jgi:hypothetical protein
MRGHPLNRQMGFAGVGWTKHGFDAGIGRNGGSLIVQNPLFPNPFFASPFSQCRYRDRAQSNAQACCAAKMRDFGGKNYAAGLALNALSFKRCG